MTLACQLPGSMAEEEVPPPAFAGDSTNTATAPLCPVPTCAYAHASPDWLKQASGQAPLPVTAFVRSPSNSIGPAAGQPD